MIRVSILQLNRRGAGRAGARPYIAALRASEPQASPAAFTQVPAAKKCTRRLQRYVTAVGGMLCAPRRALKIPHRWLQGRSGASRIDAGAALGPLSSSGPMQQAALGASTWFMAKVMPTTADEGKGMRNGRNDCAWRTPLWAVVAPINPFQGRCVAACRAAAGGFVTRMASELHGDVLSKGKLQRPKLRRPQLPRCMLAAAHSSHQASQCVLHMRVRQLAAATIEASWTPRQACGSRPCGAMDGRTRQARPHQVWQFRVWWQQE